MPATGEGRGCGGLLKGSVGQRAPPPLGRPGCADFRADARPGMQLGRAIEGPLLGRAGLRF